MVAQINEKLTESLILQNCRKELKGSIELTMQLVLELSSGNLVKVVDMDIGETFIQEDLSLSNQMMRILIRNLDVVGGLRIEEGSFLLEILLLS